MQLCFLIPLPQPHRIQGKAGRQHYAAEDSKLVEARTVSCGQRYLSRENLEHDCGLGETGWLSRNQHLSWQPTLVRKAK